MIRFHYADFEITKRFDFKNKYFVKMYKVNHLLNPASHDPIFLAWSDPASWTFRSKPNKTKPNIQPWTLFFDTTIFWDCLGNQREQWLVEWLSEETISQLELKFLRRSQKSKCKSFCAGFYIATSQLLTKQWEQPLRRCQNARINS